MKRASGILLPVFSLTGKYGIGCFSKEAYAFVDFLVETEQSYWQILPIGPSGYGGSPYQSYSTFAISPYYIDLEALMGEGLLTYEECEASVLNTEQKEVDYDLQNEGRIPLLRNAYRRFKQRPLPPDYDAFCERNADWLPHYAKFMAAHDRDKSLDGFYCFLQYIAFSQWTALRTYANERGIQIIGDLPIYVSPDGADVTQEAKLFQLDEKGHLRRVAGVPPDGFTPLGQRWGNPLYDWEYHKKTGYAWWIRRMQVCLELFDIVRIDHFRGLETYFSIPAEDDHAKNGVWEPGPGLDLFHAMQDKLGELPVIAEDLGYLTPKVKKMVKDSGFPSMKVLQFAFDGDEKNSYLPHLYNHNCVVYTGTHDNDTLMGWLEHTDEHTKYQIRKYFDEPQDVKDEILLQDLLALACISKADTCIVPLQDFLMLGSDARINTPSTVGENWKWRLSDTWQNSVLCEYIRAMTTESGRARSR